MSKLTEFLDRLFGGGEPGWRRPDGGFYRPRPRTPEDDAQHLNRDEDRPVPPPGQRSPLYKG